MAIRNVNKIVKAEREDIADLMTYRAMPTSKIDMIDPFLFLNHHGFQEYAPGNSGLPFGPHPHRGFETVTFIIEGDVAHKDTGGHESIIKAGGIQWMTAGRGLIHSEESSEEFKKTGGPLELLQLWVNLPSSLKMTGPGYKGLQKEDIPVYEADEGRVKIQLISGEWEAKKGAVKPLTDVSVMLLNLSSGGKVSLNIGQERNIFCYIVRGEANVNGTSAPARHTVLLGHEGSELDISAPEGALVLLCHAPPLKEPVASYGPFVMNTMAEIREAIQDYQSGKFN